MTVVPPRRLFAVTWRLAHCARFATPLLGYDGSRGVTGAVFMRLLDELGARDAKFDVRYTPLDRLLAVWDQYGAVLVVGPHTPVLAKPLARAIDDAGRACVGIVGSGDPVRAVAGTGRKYRQIQAGPHALFAARRALSEGKALIVMIDHISRHPNLTADRMAWIDGRPVYIYANTFRLAARLSVPIVFYSGRMQPDGSVAFMFETPHCIVPKSEEDVQSCLEEYEGFLREQIAAGRA